MKSSCSLHVASRAQERAVSLSLEFMTLLHPKVSLPDDAGNENRLIRWREAGETLLLIFITQEEKVEKVFQEQPITKLY